MTPNQKQGWIFLGCCITIATIIGGGLFMQSSRNKEIIPGLEVTFPASDYVLAPNEPATLLGYINRSNVNPDWDILVGATTNASLLLNTSVTEFQHDLAIFRIHLFPTDPLLNQTIAIQCIFQVVSHDFLQIEPLWVHIQ